MQAGVTFFGSSQFSTTVLQKLIDAHLPVSAVVTLPDKPAGRHLKLTPNPVKILAEKYRVPVYTSPQGGMVGLVAAYGRIIPQQILDKFNNQIYNIHPSLLPKYRGPSPLQNQILDGVVESGVTLIQLDDQMDHGPIVAQQKDVIHPDDTWKTLGERLFAKGADLFLQLQNPHPKPQNHQQASYTKKLTRQDGFVTWEEFQQPNKLERKLRAFANWPGVWTADPAGRRLKLLSLNPPTVQYAGEKPKLIPLPKHI